VVIVIGVFVVGGVLAAIAVPVYQDYIERARQAEINQY
jgi:Tfp pilus assembly protein PilE